MKPHSSASPETPPAASSPLRQILLISAVAVALFIGIRMLPTGTALSHMDFRASGGGAIELCDPANPQFMPALASRSPVTMTLAPAPAAAGQERRLDLTLVTSTGKPVGPADLLVVHTRKLHLLVVDPSLSDYQHLHPEPGRQPGEWSASFTPKAGGHYRIFADFTPAATGRGLYAWTDLDVSGQERPLQPNAAAVVPGSLDPSLRIQLEVQKAPVAGQPVDLTLAVDRADGADVILEPVMGAFAHLVAFDTARSGFAHLHPKDIDLQKTPDAKHPRLSFRVTLPQPGSYVIWAQLKINGTDRFKPFWISVSP